MYQIIATLLSLLVLSACGTRDQQPYLSGQIWGGAGNRLVLKHVTNPALVADTLHLNHRGELYWNPDTLVEGVYRLQDLAGNGVIMLFSRDSNIVIDGNSYDFPLNVIVKGTTFAPATMLIEQNTKNWVKAINEHKNLHATPVQALVHGSQYYRESIFDSIRAYHRQVILDLGLSPFETMYALLQEAGDYKLFDAWEQRQLFFDVDSSLALFDGIPEIDRFRRGVAFIRQVHQMDSLLRPGYNFLTIGNQYLMAAVDTAMQPGKPLYFEVKGQSQADRVKWQRHAQILERYKRAGIAVLSVTADSQQVAMLSYSGNVPRGAGSPGLSLLPDLGLTRLPANFVIDSTGVIVARDVWDNELVNVLNLLLDN